MAESARRLARERGTTVEGNPLVTTGKKAGFPLLQQQRVTRGERRGRPEKEKALRGVTR